MATLNKKLNASTLVEVLVAMLIIMVVFAIASKIYLNSFLQAPSYTKLMVSQQLKHQLQQLQNGEINPEEEVSVDGIIYHTQISKTKIEGIDLVEIRATQEKMLIAKIKGLVTHAHTDEKD